MLAGAFFLFRGAPGTPVLSGAAGGGASVAQGAAGGGPGAWVWLMVLACPLMHLFMMRGHGGQGCAKDEGKAEAKEKSPAENQSK